MKVLIRKTLTGSEYWDAKNKKTLFVPAGKNPEFKVTKNPDSMIGGVDFAAGKETTVIDEGINIEDMTVKQLHEFAKQIDVEIPADVTKKNDIIAFLSEQ